MWRRCPNCNRKIWVGEFIETLICKCGEWLHPENTKPL